MNETIFKPSTKERIVEKNSAEYFATVPRKVEKIVYLFKDIITVG